VGDVLRQPLQDGHPDHVRRQHQRPVLAEGEVDGGQQRVGVDVGDAFGGVVAAGLDACFGQQRERLVRLAGGQGPAGGLDVVKGGGDGGGGAGRGDGGAPWG